MGLLSDVRRLLGGSSPPKREDLAPEMATAALLMEMVHADFASDSAEIQTVKECLRRLVPEAEREELAEMLEGAGRHAAHSVSLYDFTEILHRELDVEAKRDIVEMLWRVAFADGALDPQEEHLVRKVSGLLHLPHEEFIGAKQSARDALALPPPDRGR